MHGERPLNALTVDVEDYFHVTAFERHVARDSWGSFPLRVERNTAVVLDLFDEYGVKGTFFVLAWVAERLPGLVREIQRRGHEVACHGYGHERLYAIGPRAFREDLRRAKGLIEHASGQAVRGYRAPSFSITRDSLWALDVLIEEGFRYDSSVFPVRHDVYGIADAPARPYRVTRPGGTILEFPLSTLAVGFGSRRLRVPVAGGGYLRLFPLWFLKLATRRINARDGVPAVLYFHPWEIDPGQPRIPAGLRSRLRHYQGLRTTLAKLRGLLASFPYAPMGQVLGIAA